MPLELVGPPRFEGRTLAGYRVMRALACGGMATVFAAKKEGPGRYAQSVALKIMHPHLAGEPALRTLFENEARLGSCVNHPNVCRVLEFAESDGICLLALEYVRGETFSALLDALVGDENCWGRGLALTVHVLARACEGLHAIHSATDSEGRPLGIVHCDISPENLMVGYDGSVRWIDFGIAVAEGAAQVEALDTLRGRYAFMSPEQIQGQRLDRRADVWSMGVILCEALTGENPFARATQAETMQEVIQGVTLDWPPHVPPELCAIAERALALAPHERFQSARALGDALTGFLNTCGESDRSHELGVQMQRWFSLRMAQKRAIFRELDDEAARDPTLPAYSVAAVTRERAAPATAPRKTISTPVAREPSRQRSFQAACVTLLLLPMAISWYFAASTVAPPATTQAQPSTRAVTASRALTSTSPFPPEAPASPAPNAYVQAAAPRPRADLRRASSRPGIASTARSPNIALHTAQGTLVIGGAPGWADIYERGRKLGSTPLRVKLAPGAHRLTVRPYGDGRPRSVNVAVRHAETIRIHLAL